MKAHFTDETRNLSEVKDGEPMTDFQREIEAALEEARKNPTPNMPPDDYIREKAKIMNDGLIFTDPDGTVHISRTR